MKAVFGLQRVRLLWSIRRSPWPGDLSTPSQLVSRGVSARFGPKRNSTFDRGGRVMPGNAAVWRR